MRKMTSNEFDKWIPDSLNLEREKKLIEIAKLGWLAGLRWVVQTEHLARTQKGEKFVFCDEIENEIKANEEK